MMYNYIIKHVAVRSNNMKKIILNNDEIVDLENDFNSDSFTDLENKDLTIKEYKSFIAGTGIEIKEIIWN